MEDSEGSANGLPPFLTKTYEMVEEPSTNYIVSWSQNGFSFVVWNPPEFARDLLPTYFKHNNFSSFVRQLNTYGFRKMDREQWEFANDEFIRGRRDLLKNIYRRKPVHSHSLVNQIRSTPLTDGERQEFEEKIKRLKHENSLLEMKFQNHQRENEEFGNKMQTFYQRLGQVENQQKKLVSFVAEQIQKPGFMSKFIENTEIQSRKRRLSKSKTCPDEFCLVGENSDSESNIMGQIEKLESFLKLYEAFLQEITEVMEDPETNGTGRTRYFPSLDSSPRLYLNDRIIDRTTSLDIDEISISKCQLVPQIEVAREEVTAELTDSLQTGVNDGFWEQFLTETPAGNHSLERERD